MVITEATRRAILDELQLGESWWWGRLDEPSFLARLYPLAEMPSTDPRFEDAALDIWQHRERNNDWDSDWVFYDSRFELMEDDTRFLRFLAETVHPVVRTSQEEVTEMVAMYNRHLAPDGFELTEVAQISGRPTPANVPGDSVQVRVPTADYPQTQRTVEQVPPSEIRKAMINLVQDAHAIDEGELFVRVARIFGWGRNGAVITRNLAAQLELLNGRQVLVKRDGRISLATPTTD
jgi:hypothetical protein